MPTYNLRFTDTTKDPIVIFPKSLDGPGANRVHTDLRLYGQGSELWGEGMAEDLLRLLENFASPEVGSPPGPANLASPIEGQIWFNQTDDSAYVYRPLLTPQWQRMAQDGESYTVAEIDALIALYYNKVESDARYVEVAGDTMTGQLDIVSALTASVDGNTEIRTTLVSEGSPLLENPGGFVAVLDSTAGPDSGGLLIQTGDNNGDEYALAVVGYDDTFVFGMRVDGDTTWKNGATVTLSQDPTAALHAATKQYVDGLVGGLSSIPAGTMTAFAGASAPTDWLFCNGASVSRSTYSVLFGVIGVQYGSASGTTFNLPDMRGRAAIAQDGGAGRVGNSQGDVLGGSLGTENHTLSSSQVPNHNHSASSANNGGHTHKIKALLKSTEGDSPDYSFQHVGFAGSTNKSGFVVSEPDHKHTITVNWTAGGGGSHNNMQPTLAVNWIIRT